MRSIIVVLVLFSTSVLAIAQMSEVRGTQPVSEGRRYMVAFPQVWNAPSEQPLTQPMLVLISSRTGATIVIKTPAVINDAARLDEQLTVEPNKVLMVPISTAYMNAQSETLEGYGIEITSDQLISVSSVQQWNGNGEVTRHLPVEAWGTSYRTMNFYQDRYGSSGSDKYRPSQILIVAWEDNTFITYTPTVSTEGGAASSSVAKGTARTIKLRRGETFLIKDKIDVTLLKNFKSDLSGTLITSTKPVGVISGHTKCAVMRYPEFVPPSGPLYAEAHFVRNNMHEAMMPLKFAGTEFVVIPCMYTPLRVTGYDNAAKGIDNDRGDVVRILALSDSTLVKRKREDTGGFVDVVLLKAGESYLDTAFESATMFTTSKPALCGQYGKSYAKVLPTEIEKRSDAVEGFPSVEAGMPMLQTVPSVDRYVSYATFNSLEGMDNFLNIVCRCNYLDSIKVDGRVLKTAFGGSFRVLNGIDYCYIRTPIAEGEHTIESVNDSIRWMAWSYGSLDGLEQGRAYGSPVSVDQRSGCNDSIVVNESFNCGNIQGTVEIRSQDTACSKLYDIVMVSGSNYQLVALPNTPAVNKTWVFSVNVLNKKQNATATIRFTSLSGNYLEKTYTYTADPVAWTPTVVDWGALPVGTGVTKSFTITNASNNSDLFVRSVKPKHLPTLFSLSPSGGFTIPPGGTQQIQITAIVQDTNAKIDTAIIELRCFTQLSAELRINAGDPTSVAEITDGSHITLSPMPVILSQHQFVSISTVTPYDRLSVYDVAGREVYHMHITSTEFQIPTSAFIASGVYALRLSCTNNETVVPLMCLE